MKRLFKNILIPTIVGPAILPIAGCSCHTGSGGGEIETSGSIEILSDISDITVCQTEDHISSPVQVKCIGKNKQKLGYSFNLTLEGNEKLPNWISITDKDEIEISGGKEIGSYSFTLSARNESEKLYSNTKTFKVNVVDDRHIVPLKLTTNIIDDQYYQFAEVSSIPITVTPSKEGVEEQYLLNEVKCYVEVVSGKTKGLDGNDLFTIKSENNNHCLKISASTDDTYNGDYTIKITSVLLADPTINDSKTITIHIANTRESYDPTSMCYFERGKNDNGWTVTKMDSSSTKILDLPSSIQNRPVDKIGVNFCSKSGITNLVEVILPESIYKIGDNAFADQTALALVEMPGVTWVGSDAFKNDSLMEYRIRGKYPQIKVLGNNCFKNCTKLKLNEQNEITWIGKNACDNAGFSDFTIGEKCTYIGVYAFANCAKLSNFTILAKTPPTIGGALFKDCSEMTTIHVPSDCVDAYKTNTSWKSLGLTIEGI